MVRIWKMMTIEETIDQLAWFGVCHLVLPPKQERKKENPWRTYETDFVRKQWDLAPSSPQLAEFPGALAILGGRGNALDAIGIFGDTAGGIVLLSGARSVAIVNSLGEIAIV